MPTKILATHRKAALALAALLILAIPLPHRIAPVWPMRVIDQFGDVQAGMATTQTWRHPAYQAQLQTETRRTDDRGQVSFPERTVWGSGLRYLYGIVANVARQGTDAALAPEVWVYARQDEFVGGSNVYTRGQTPPDTVVIHRYGVCVCKRPPHRSAAPGGTGPKGGLSEPGTAKTPALDNLSR